MNSTKRANIRSIRAHECGLWTGISRAQKNLAVLKETRELIRHPRASACLAELLRPAAQHSIVRLLDIDEFDAHADSGLYDAHHSERFHFLIFSCQCDPYARVGRQWLAGANKHSTHGQVGSYTFRPRSGFQIQHECIGGKRIADTKAAVPDRNAPGVAIRCAVVHENNVAHSRPQRPASGRDLPVVNFGLTQCALKSLQLWCFQVDRTAKEAIPNRWFVAELSFLRYYLERQTAPSQPVPDSRAC